MLLGFLLVSGAIDRWRFGPAARRPREYGWLLLAGGLGALFGLAVDQATSRLSPDYFVYGKGLDPGPGFARDVLLLSLQAGLAGGLCAGGVLLLVNQPAPARGPVLPVGGLLRAAAWIVALALLAAPLGAAAARAWDPLDLRHELRGVLDDPDRQTAFVTVWGLHAGVYAGALVGLVIAAVRVRRARGSG